MRLKDCVHCQKPFESSLDSDDHCPSCLLIVDALQLTKLKAKVAKHLEALALIYACKQPAFVAVAKICDEYLDSSGSLLGDIRERAAVISASNLSKGTSN